MNQELIVNLGKRIEEANFPFAINVYNGKLSFTLGNAKTSIDEPLNTYKVFKTLYKDNPYELLNQIVGKITQLQVANLAMSILDREKEEIEQMNENIKILLEFLPTFIQNIAKSPELTPEDIIQATDDYNREISLFAMQAQIVRMNEFFNQYPHKKKITDEVTTVRLKKWDRDGTYIGEVDEELVYTTFLIDLDQIIPNAGTHLYVRCIDPQNGEYVYIKVPDTRKNRNSPINAIANTIHVPEDIKNSDQ